MTEINEIIAVAVPHGGSSNECPFCPIEPPSEFTTYPGEENNSGKLGSIMQEPATLTSEQDGTRPKQGGLHQQSTSDAQTKPNPIFSDLEEGAYSTEAHHLISGKQALMGHAFERWILASKSTITEDTGYSVNNADNGIWCPSIPEKYKGGNWGAKSFATKLAIASKPMEAGHPQFHKGNHSIGDPEDTDGDDNLRQKYDIYLKNMLTEMDERMFGWSDKCPLCFTTKGIKKKKLQPSVRVNQVLDNLSKVVRRKVSAPASEWRIFLSRYSLEYAKELDGPRISL